MFGGWEIRRGNMWRVAAVLAASATLAVSGCSAGGDSGSSKSSSAAPSVTAEKVDAIANTVPEAIKSSGKLIVGVNIPYAPNEFKDPSGKIVGFDVDLMNAIAATLGLQAEFREADFAKIIPSIQGDTFNVGMSSFTDAQRDVCALAKTQLVAGGSRPSIPDRSAWPFSANLQRRHLTKASAACSDEGRQVAAR